MACDKGYRDGSWNVRYGREKLMILVLVIFVFYSSLKILFPSD